MANEEKHVPINKGNYSMDTAEREAQFEAFRGDGWSQDYHAYRNNWSEFPKTQYVSDYPLLVDIELSSICNLKCPMCYTISDEFKQFVNTKRMDFDLFKKVIDEIDGKVPAIRLSLRGEATLHTRFHEAVKYAKSHGIKEVSFLTHGGKLKLDYFAKLVDAGVDWITVSIDGVGDTYERIRKPLKFDRLLENLKNIKDYKAKHNLKRPVIKIQGIWPAILESGVDTYYNTFEPISDLIAFNPLIDYLFKDEDIDYVNAFTCPQQYQRMVVGADGLVMKCSNDEENKEVIGDLNLETVHQVWHGEKMNAVRKLHLEENGFLKSEVCRRCYLPRKTIEEVTEVNGRTLIVKNYSKRAQTIGD